MQNIKKKSYTAAFCGVCTALIVVFMLTSTIIPIFTYAAPLYASFILIPVVYELGESKGWMVWIASSLLCLILIPDKEAAFFFLFTGFLPVIKKRFDMIRSFIIRMSLWSVMSFGLVSLMYLLLIYVLKLDSVLRDIGESGVLLFVILNSMVAVVLIFDYKLIEIITRLYIRVLRPKLKFLNGKKI